MSDERVMILKMLQEEKISVEEAEALLQALESREDEDTGFSAETNSEHNTHHHKRRDRSEHRKGRRRRANFDFDIDLDFSELGEQLRETFGELGNTFKETFKDFKGFDEGFSLRFGKHNEEEVKTFTFPLDGIDELKLSNKWGNIEIRGDDRTDLSVEAQIMVWADDAEDARRRLDGINIDFDQASGTVDYASATKSGLDRVRVNYRISVPRVMNLNLENLSGNITIEDTEGEVRARTMSGDIRIDGCAGDLDIKSASGDIRLRASAKKIDGKSASGDIRAEVSSAPEAISFNSASGDLTLEIPADSAVDLNISTVSGDISTQGELDASVDKEHRFEGKLGDGGNPVNLNSVSGDVLFRAI